MEFDIFSDVFQNIPFGIMMAAPHIKLREQIQTHSCIQWRYTKTHSGQEATTSWSFVKLSNTIRIQQVNKLV